ncbi:MAG: DUF2470 domain-containing protein, partial [Candidatus Binatota bacterium]|nr:DUF2470 domain-containing protein [Candidatus Binatota bacterium]
SVLVGEIPETGDALVGPRVTVLGRFERVEDGNLRRRYLARHPQAAMYADFADFSFWRLEPASIHGVAGFGRIETLEPRAVFPAVSEMDALETSAIEHMNRDHGDSVQLYATRLLGGAPENWQVLAIDPVGADLGAAGQGLRLSFEEPVTSADGLRRTFAELSKKARETGL